jgi:hypothetical protein
MPRIFACLAAANLILLAGAGLLGLMGPAFGQDRHILLAVFTLLYSCFIPVLTFTYFTVTGKMIGQMVHLSGLNPAHLDQIKRLKKSITHWLALLVASVVLTSATGGYRWGLETRSWWHLFAAALTLLIHLFVFYRQYNLIVTNARLFDRTASEYSTWKSARKQAAQAP